MPHLSCVVLQVDRFTSRYASPVLCSRELSSLHDPNCIAGLTVKARPAAREVLAGYAVGDTTMELTVTLPSNLPLGQVTVSGDERRAGVQKSQWRTWMLQLTVFLTYQVCYLLGMYRISGSGWPDIRPFFESGSGSSQNGTRYRISQPDSAQSFLAVS